MEGEQWFRRHLHHLHFEVGGQRWEAGGLSARPQAQDEKMRHAHAAKERGEHTAQDTEIERARVDWIKK